MTGNTNSIASYESANPRELQEAAGITQFPSATEMFQVLNGLQIQVGKVDVAGGATLTVNFPAPYEKQVLGVFLQVLAGAENGAYIDPVPALASFDLHNGAGNRSYYWWAIGV